MTCDYCTSREALGKHHGACPARPTPEEVGAGQRDSSRLAVVDLAAWRQGYDDAARGKAPKGDALPTYQLGWAIRVTRESAQTRPALFLSLRALLERLRGRDRRTDSFGIQLASSLLYLDGDARLTEAVVRSWPSFPRLREASQDEERRMRARHVLTTSTDEAARREAATVLNGEPDDEARLWVKQYLRTAEASGRISWREDRDIDLAEVDALLEGNGFTATGLGGVDLLASTHPQAPSQTQCIAAIIEAANGGNLLAAA